MKKNNQMITSGIRNFTIKIIFLFAITITIISCHPKSQKLDNTTEKNVLVNVLSIDSSFVLDLKYATDDNFLGKPVYNVAKCYLLKSAATKLAEANKACKKIGLRIKIFDGYRPYSVQKEMWKLVPDSRYVANPANGSNHNRGCAVDVTLIDSLGNELTMPTGFDDFTQKAHHDYMDLPDEAIKNRELLKNIMIEAGFVPLSTEWWHYSTKGCKEKKILNIPL